MKKWVILLLVLVFVIPICLAVEISIPEMFEVEELPQEDLGKEVYFYAGSKLIASKNNDEIKYQYQNRLGSDVDSKSLPFGQEIKKGERFSFTGKELDGDLYYFNARYYDPEIGRFTSVDPVKDNHPYSYVANNPMNLVDPSGMDEYSVADNVASFVDDQWGAMIAPHIDRVTEVANQLDIPPEAMLAQMLYEDGRGFAPDFSSSISATYLKAKLRRALPNLLMESLGHRANPEKGSTSFGVVYSATVEGAIGYLRSLDGLGEGTLNILDKSSYSSRKGGLPDGSFGTCYDINGLDDAERLGLAIKANMEYWSRSGYDIMSYDFSTLKTHGDRIALIQLLTMSQSYEKYSFYDYATERTISPGFYRADVYSGMVKGPVDLGFQGTLKRAYVPSSSPGLGGTAYWGTTSSNVVKAFVDSGIAGSMLNN